MGVHGLICVILGVIDVKKVENHVLGEVRDHCGKCKISQTDAEIDTSYYTKKLNCSIDYKISTFWRIFFPFRSYASARCCCCRWHLQTPLQTLSVYLWNSNQKLSEHLKTTMALHLCFAHCPCLSLLKICWEKHLKGSHASGHLLIYLGQSSKSSTDFLSMSLIIVSCIPRLFCLMINENDTGRCLCFPC